MKTSFLLTAALLVGATAVGTALAAGVPGVPVVPANDTRTCVDPGDRAACAEGARFRVADRGDGHGRREHRRDRHRHHGDDDDDDRGRCDRDGGGIRPRLPVTGPTDPAAPVPDNGLFQGKARPKVEVN